MRRFIFFQVCLFSAILFSIQPDASAKGPASLDWLKISEDAKANWRMEISPEDPGVMEISPGWILTGKSLKKRIFMILPKNSSSYSLAASVFLEALHAEGIQAEITLMNFNKEEERGETFIRLAEEAGADLIFSMGSESQSFLHNHYSGGNIQVVTCTSKDPVMLGFLKDYETGSGTNIAYTSLNVPLSVQLNYLHTLKPKLKNIGLMYDETHKQVMATEVMPAKKLFESLGFNVLSVAVQSDKKKARGTLSVLVPIAVESMIRTDPSLENSIFWLTSSTSVFSNMDVVMGCAGDVPVIGSIPNAVKEGENSAVLAIGIDRRNNARLASIYAMNILKGETAAGDLKVGVVTPPDIAVNFLVARKIGLKIPFPFFESAAFIYDYYGKTVRAFGQKTGGSHEK